MLGLDIFEDLGQVCFCLGKRRLLGGSRSRAELSLRFRRRNTYSYRIELAAKVGRQTTSEASYEEPAPVRP
jgi:hypothetical protein